ncbi:MAG: glycosyltransferase family 4 protein [Planctomycetaceae bacterium]|nr:glycosyltransferase family 4 protein [Planctomycetaceae bacterium]
MSGPRLVIVSRTFWPVIDDSTFRLQSWLHKFEKLNVDVSLVTALWNYRWPLKCTFEEVPLFRIGPPPFASRSFKNYIKAVVDHLILHRTEYDAILFDKAAEECVATCQSKELVDKNKLFWFEHHEQVDGVLSLANVTQDACRSADRILVHGAAEERTLRSVGIMADKIERLGHVSLVHLPRTLGERSRARTILRECCGDLFVPTDGKVIIVPSELQHRASIDMFLQAIDPLLDRWPSLRVWFVGDGPERGRIYERIRDMDGARQIALPGCFDSVEEIFQLADVCVLTTPGEGLGYFAPLAWQNNIPCLLPMSSCSKERTPESARWGIYHPGNMPQLRELIAEALAKSTAATNHKLHAADNANEAVAWSLERWRTWGLSHENRTPRSSHSSSVIERSDPNSSWKKWRI